MTEPHRKKLIEVALPLEAINRESAREKNPFTRNHPRSIHLWWARRPLAACRAVIFASLVDLGPASERSRASGSVPVRAAIRGRQRSPGAGRDRRALARTAALMTGDRSDPRNPELVRMFRFIGLAEEAGTGMPKIIRAWRDLGFQLPAVDVGKERYEFSLRLRHAHLISADDREWLASLGDSWQEAEQLAMVITRHEGEVNNLRLRTVTGQHPTDATKVLGSLRDRGLLQMIGGKRSARYELGPAASSGDSGLGSGDSEPSSGDSRPSSGDNELSSGGKVPDSGDKPIEMQELWSQLEALAAVARERRRLDVASLESTIVSLCALTPLSLRELAGLLHRGEDRLRPALRGLIAAGRLTYLYSAKITHPGQKYVAAGASAMEAR